MVAYSRDEYMPLAIEAGQALLAAGLRAVTAESCTGGGLAAALTDVPGSSDWFERGYVTYSNAAKIQELGVERGALEQHGAVSAEVARQMALGALQASGTDVVVAVTGVAGPDGGTLEKPVGLVYLAWGRRGGPLQVVRELFAGDRAEVRSAAVAEGLRLLDPGGARLTKSWQAGPIYQPPAGGPLWDNSVQHNRGEPGMEENRKKALAAALSQIEKQFGKGSVMRLGDAPAIWDIEAVPTGSLGLDIALGCGGLPRGRVVEIYGPESSGKTTLTLAVVAEIQKRGGTAAFVDAEHALDPAYAEKLGVNIQELLVSQPDTGEQALEITDMLVRSGGVDLVVIDSVAALTPRAEIEGEMGELQVGLHARLMSQALRKLTGNIKRSNTIVIFINQIRMKIGVMFGSPETTTGGNALKFYASVRLDIRRIGAIKNGEEVVGNQTRVKVVKNKVAPPFRECEFEIMYGQGISHEGEIIEIGGNNGIIEKSGSWYSYKGERIGQGKDNAREFLKTHPQIAQEIEELIRAKLLPAKLRAEPEEKSA